MHTLITDFLEQSAEKYPDKTAIVCQDRRYTYAEVDVMANKLAATLQKEGIEKGDRVAVFMDNSVEAVVSIFAVLKAGAAFIVINHTTKTAKLNHLLNYVRAGALISQKSKAGTIEGVNCPHLRSVIMAGTLQGAFPALSYDEIMHSPENGRVQTGCIDLDLAALIYTSGSSGNPKGVMLSHRNMVSAADSITTYLQNNEDDVIINVLPLSFDYGLYQVLMAFKIGGTVILENSFAYPYLIIDKVMKEKVTGFPGVPTIFAMLLQMKDISRYDLSSIRYMTSTAAPLPVGHIRKLRNLCPNAKLYSMYGLTECKRVSYLDPEEIDARPTSVGKGMPNQECYIVNERGERARPGEAGELVVRGSHVMMGYWEMPEDTAQSLKAGNYPGEKVFFTGDLFKTDEEGYLYFIARKDDIIKSKGEKVSPREIENVLYDLDGIQEAAVTGVPDEILGQAIKVYVVTDGKSELTREMILNHCSRHLENFKIPKYVEMRSSLPKTDTGKIRKGSISSGTVFTYLRDHALHIPDKVAVVHKGRRITYKELERSAVKLASFLMQRGMEKGDRVAVLSENSPEYIASCFAIQMTGGIAVDINPQFSSHEMGTVLNDCGARTFIIEKQLMRSIREMIGKMSTVNLLIIMDAQPKGPEIINTIEEKIPLGIELFALSSITGNEYEDEDFPEVYEGDIASIVYTSGTTGEPKGVMLSHGNFVSNARSIIEYLNLGKDERIMVILPFYYSYGKSLLNTHIMTGGTLVLENSFMYPNAVLDRMLEECVTGFAGVPSTFAILLNRSNIRNYEFPGLKYVTQAGGALSPTHARELSGILRGKNIYIMYGQTEATARLTYLPPRDIFKKSGSIGRAIPGVEIEVLKENGVPAETGEAGEIVASGASIMMGYWNKPEETARVLKGNRLFTGDIARRDGDGYLYIVGRRSDMIKSGAHRISPKEIEEVILEMPEIYEVSVVGVEDDILGETIKAVVVLKDGVGMDPKKIKKHCKTKLAPFKVPRDIVFVEELPKTRSGKVKRHLCKELC